VIFLVYFSSRADEETGNNRCRDQTSRSEVAGAGVGKTLHAAPVNMMGEEEKKKKKGWLLLDGNP